ncbi:hypothetical protein [Modestobacter caceresii]|uniref:hypothetical protein n=1 Tax=Modestobacter caceresii TaxID=1522368 RepID=UPI0012E0689B|nr:hypothetical protein [Modestobacter caceresii]
MSPEVRGRRFRVLLLLFSALGAVLGTVAGQLLGLAVGLGFVATLLGAAGVFLALRSSRDRASRRD